MKPAAPYTQAMQRVRVGMVGLAAVILLIGLASAIFSAVSHERPIAAAGAPRADAIANMTAANAASAAEAGNEPLAQLGVAPSASEADTPPPNTPK
jgi:cobalamin synthase